MSFGYPSANNPLPAGHATPQSPVGGVQNNPKSTQTTLTGVVK